MAFRLVSKIKSVTLSNKFLIGHNNLSICNKTEIFKKRQLECPLSTTVAIQNKKQENNGSLVNGTRQLSKKFLCTNTENLPTVSLELFKLPKSIGSVRVYSKACKNAKRKKANICPNMTLKGCKPRTRIGCPHIKTLPECEKILAPYPSYSECKDDDWEVEHSECTHCPWPTRPVKPVEMKGHKKYSTMAAHAIYMAPTKKPKPCKIPIHPKEKLAPCNYEKVAEIRKWKRRRRFARKLPKKVPKGKKYSTIARPSCREYSTSVTSRIKNWLNARRPENSDVRCAGPSNIADVEDREIHEIQVKKVIRGTAEHSKILTNLTVVNTGNLFKGERPIIDITEPMRPDSSGGMELKGCGKKKGLKKGCGKLSHGCPNTKKKKKLKKRTCSKLRKRPLPKCPGQKGKKGKKRKMVSVDETFPSIRSQGTVMADVHIPKNPEVLNITSDVLPRQSDEAPMKLKPQFWSKYSKTSTLPVKKIITD